MYEIACKKMSTKNIYKLRITHKIIQLQFSKGREAHPQKTDKPGSIRRIDRFSSCKTNISIIFIWLLFKLLAYFLRRHHEMKRHTLIQVSDDRM